MKYALNLHTTFTIERFPELLKSSLNDRFSHLFHEIQVVVEVVDGGEPEIGDLVGPEEVSHIGA